ncbi:MAG: alpha/beta hydrolase fold protein, partial [Chitinophagaceae bacterium]|nr:alpha/beta hydrolase fold protein [Chitinophagaceae bacterium]
IGIDNFKNAGMPMSPERKLQADDLLKRLETDFANSCEAYARMVLLTPQTNALITDKVVAAYRNPDPVMGLLSIKSVLSYYKRERNLLQQLKFKLHLINVDYIATQEEPLKKFAANGYKLIHLQGTCHFPMIENSSAFNEKLEQVLLAV